MKSFYLFGMACVMLFALSIVGCFTTTNEKRGGVSIERYDLSPDGKLILLEFTNPNKPRTQSLQTALYDWQSDKLRILDYPAREEKEGWMRFTSFTPDGKGLLTLSFIDSKKTDDWFESHLYRIDLEQDTITHLAQLPILAIPRKTEKAMQLHYAWRYPALQPGTNKILFVAEAPLSIGDHLVEYDLDSQKSRVILDPKTNGFKWILTARFIGKDEIMFDGLVPFNDELKQKIKSYGVRRYDFAFYHLKFGNSPELVFPRSKEDTSSNRKIKAKDVTSDGKTISLVGLSETQPYAPQGWYNHEVYTLTNNVLTQRTNVKQHILRSRMSRNGSYVVFQGRSDRNGPRDQGHQFYMLDLKRDWVSYIPLMARLKQHIDATVKIH